MNLLKRIPIHYKGELHDVRLINFSVDMREISGKIPPAIKPRNFNGRAMISMVDVKLKNMRPSALPFMRFNYRHVAFRLLVEDGEYNGGANKGIFFFRSFTSKPLIALGGRLLTDYNLEMADITEKDNEVRIVKGTNHVKYCISDAVPAPNEELTNMIGALDRAYAASGKGLRMTQIQRERWPIQLTACSGFEDSFFKTARLEGAFRVAEIIHYEWLRPKNILS